MSVYWKAFLSTMSQKTVIVGCGGSGKDYLMSLYKKRGFKDAILHTTREIRSGEISGVDYHFVTVPEFEAMRESRQFVVCGQWGDLMYGVSKKAWDNADIIELTPRYLAQLSPSARASCFVVYLLIPESIRRVRLLDRHKEDTSVAQRRLISDREQFEDFEDFDIRITDPNF